MFSERVLLAWLLVLNFFANLECGAPQQLPPDEVQALEEIAEKLNRPPWNFSADACRGDSSWVTPSDSVSKGNSSVSCIRAGSFFHVTQILVKKWNLSGVLPQLTRLPNLSNIDLTRNYLNGTIPVQWASTQLRRISLGANRLSGSIPKELGNMTALTSLVLESNQLSGDLPVELGNLANIERFIISSNNFTGKLPEELAKLSNLKDFRISDNRFTGKIPDFMQSWTKLENIHIQGTDMEGPIPPGISGLVNMMEILISDISGPESPFPNLSSMESMQHLVLKNCNLVGEIPSYIGEMKKLALLDLSFNKLAGKIPALVGLPDLTYLFLTSNLLTGPTEDWMFKLPANEYPDLSYNNLTMGSPPPQNCQQGSVNLFGSSSMGTKRKGVLPCSEKIFNCLNYRYSLHINCGGERVKINKNTEYEEDSSILGASSFVLKDGWAISSTGTFVNNNSPTDTYIASNKSKLSMPNSELYATARLSPLSLTYYGFCLQNGNYTLKLHFAEIIITDDQTYSSLGRRFFDIYVQGKLFLKDFNIINEVGGSGREVVKNFSSIPVANHTLEIRFIWAGRGTQIVPGQGTYGPLISALSLELEFPISKSSKKISAGVIIGLVASVSFLIFLVLLFLWSKGCLGGKSTKDKGRNY